MSSRQPHRARALPVYNKFVSSKRLTQNGPHIPFQARIQHHLSSLTNKLYKQKSNKGEASVYWDKVGFELDHEGKKSDKLRAERGFLEEAQG